MFSTQSGHETIQLLLHFHLNHTKLMTKQSIWKLMFCCCAGIFFFEQWNVKKLVDEASSHPQRVYSPGDIVPGNRQRKQRAPQFGEDAIMEDVLVGVVVWKWNTGNDEA